jgi:hypothetical protein
MRPRFDIRYDTSDLDRPTHPPPLSIDDDPLVRTVSRLNPPRDFFRILILLLKSMIVW